jgi:hypothetical protein
MSIRLAQDFQRGDVVSLQCVIDRLFPPRNEKSVSGEGLGPLELNGLYTQIPDSTGRSPRQAYHRRRWRHRKSIFQHPETGVRIQRFPDGANAYVFVFLGQVKTLPPYPDAEVIVPEGHVWVEGK